MAKIQNVRSKNFKMEDIRAHFFMSIVGNHIEIMYNDDLDNGAGLGAAFCSAMQEDEKLYGILAAAILSVGKDKNNSSNWEKVKVAPKKKSISKTAKTVVKKPTKAAKRK